MSALNPASALPLYAQLADQILARIRAGEFAEGEKIPSENVLAERYGIGRPTVRQATETLIRRGYLVRRRGSGTYVVEREGHVDLFSLGGTLSSFERQGLTLSTRLEEAPRLVTEDKGQMAARLSYRLKRVGSVEERPVLIETFWFDAQAFPFFDKLDIAGRSLSEVVHERYRMEATSADQTFSVVTLAQEDAQLLHVAEMSPVLLVERVLHFRAARAGVLARMLCLTDRFRFSQHISSAAAGFSAPHERSAALQSRPGEISWGGSAAPNTRSHS